MLEQLIKESLLFLLKDASIHATGSRADKAVELHGQLTAAFDEDDKRREERRNAPLNGEERAEAPYNERLEVADNLAKQAQAKQEPEKDALAKQQEKKT
jgi:hypothetical protein